MKGEPSYRSEGLSEGGGGGRSAAPTAAAAPRGILRKASHHSRKNWPTEPIGVSYLVFALSHSNIYWPETVDL